MQRFPPPLPNLDLSGTDSRKTKGSRSPGKVKDPPPFLRNWEGGFPPGASAPPLLRLWLRSACSGWAGCGLGSPFLSPPQNERTDGGASETRQLAARPSPPGGALLLSDSARRSGSRLAADGGGPGRQDAHLSPPRGTGGWEEWGGRFLLGRGSPPPRSLEGRRQKVEAGRGGSLEVSASRL